MARGSHQRLRARPPRERRGLPDAMAEPGASTAVPTIRKRASIIFGRTAEKPLSGALRQAGWATGAWAAAGPGETRRLRRLHSAFPAPATVVAAAGRCAGRGAVTWRRMGGNWQRAMDALRTRRSAERGDSIVEGARYRVALGSSSHGLVVSAVSSGSKGERSELCAKGVFARLFRWVKGGPCVRFWVLVSEVRCIRLAYYGSRVHHRAKPTWGVIGYGCQ